MHFQLNIDVKSSAIEKIFTDNINNLSYSYLIELKTLVDNRISELEGDDSDCFFDHQTEKTFSELLKTIEEEDKSLQTDDSETELIEEVIPQKESEVVKKEKPQQKPEVIKDTPKLVEEKPQQKPEVSKNTQNSVEENPSPQKEKVVKVDNSDQDKSGQKPSISLLSAEEIDDLLNQTIILDNGQEASDRVKLGMSKPAWRLALSGAKARDMDVIEYIKTRELTEQNQKPKGDGNNNQNQDESLKKVLGLSDSQWTRLKRTAKRNNVTPLEWYNSSKRVVVAKDEESLRIQYNMGKPQFQKAKAKAKEMGITIEAFLKQQGKGNQHAKTHIINEFKSSQNKAEKETKTVKETVTASKKL
jgi:hypothetical protein